MVNILKAKKVAVISDTTGYGTDSLDAYVPMLKTMGAEVVYQGSVEANNPAALRRSQRFRSTPGGDLSSWPPPRHPS